MNPVFDDFKFCVQEIHSILEVIIDDVILRAYLNREPPYVKYRIKADFFLKLILQEKLIYCKTYNRNVNLT